MIRSLETKDMVNAPGTSPRVHDFLETVLLMLLFVTVFTGTLFGLRYESYSPLVGAFSGRYLVAGLVPAVVVLVVICGLLLRPSLHRRMPAIGGRFVAPVVLGSAIPALVGVLLWTSGVPESRLALALAIAVPALGALVVARALARPQLVLCVLPIVVVGAVLLVVEVPMLAREAPMRWGDDRLFAYLHPTDPPFMGPGGRLRADVDCDQMSAEFPRGAAVITNRDGFRNRREFGRAPGDETRILSMGDSFSAGYAMPQDLFFGSLLERGARERMPQRNIVVLNAEVSNPAHGLYYLQEFGLRYRPRVVLYGLSGNDLVQTEHFFGPRARFTMDASGAIVVNPAFDRRRPGPIVRFRDFVYPSATPTSHRSGLSAVRRVGDRWARHFGGLAVSSWLGSCVPFKPRPVPMFSYAGAFEREDGRKRLIDGQSDLGLFYPPGASVVESVYRQFFVVLEGLQRTAEQAGAELVLVIFPQRFQLQLRDWEVMCDHWSLDDRLFDLSRPNRRIAELCAVAGIECLDLLAPMREAAAQRELYLPGGDMHLNSAGCRVAAGITIAFVDRILAGEGRVDDRDGSSLEQGAANAPGL